MRRTSPTLRKEVKTLVSEVAEGAMDEEQQGASADHDDDAASNSSPPKVSAAVGDIIEGKRAKKTVERLDFQAPMQKKLQIGDGSGEKLGDIPRTGYQITKMKTDNLKPLHIILFDRPGKMSTIKRNLRLFNGFPFLADSDQYSKKREKLLKSSQFTNAKLKLVCTVLDLEKKGTHSDLVDRILNFLVAPKNSRKPVPVKKKRKSKKKLSGEDSATKTKKKTKNKPKLNSPKKTGSKSKAIVMDSSSDEDEEEEEEKTAPSTETEGSDDKPSETEGGASDKEEESEDSKEENEEEESSKTKSSRKKRQREPAKKKALPRKRARKVSSDKSEADSEEEQPKKKKMTPSKPAAKTKKADSSSNSKTANTADDSSEEDESLIKMVRKTVPSEEQLRETVQRLLENASLEDMTMKQICQQVFDKFPEHDLSDKKGFIKQTVKSLIT